MDPEVVLALIGDETADRRDRLEACWDLRDWLRRGGFEPDSLGERFGAWVWFIWACTCTNDDGEVI